MDGCAQAVLGVACSPVFPPEANYRGRRDGTQCGMGAAPAGWHSRGDLALLVQEAGCAPSEWGGHCTPSDPPASPP